MEKLFFFFLSEEPRFQFQIRIFHWLIKERDDSRRQQNGNRNFVQMIISAPKNSSIAEGFLFNPRFLYLHYNRLKGKFGFL